MNPTDAYLQTLRRELAFDPQLADRIAHEVGDHFDEMLGEHPDQEDCRQAVLCMGDPKLLAASVAQAALPRRLKTTWYTLALAVCAVFLAMRLRTILAPTVETDAVWVILARLVDLGAFLMALAATGLGFLLARRSTNQIAAPAKSIRMMEAAVAMLAASGLAGAGILVASGLAHAGQLGALPLTAAVLEWAALLLAFGAIRKTVLQSRLSQAVR